MVSLPRKERESGLYAPVWEKINGLVDYLRAITPRGGRGVKVTTGINGTTFVADIDNRSGATLRQFRINSIQNDFYTCHEWSGTEEIGEEVYIARPFTHRVSNFHGQTISFDSDGDSFSATYSYSSPTKRTKTISGVAETQVLIPLFKADFDIIYAMECDQTLTAGPSNTPITDPNEDPITLVEVLGEGRAWSTIES